MIYDTHLHSETNSDIPKDDRDIDPPQKFQTFYVDKPVIGLTGGIGSGKQQYLTGSLPKVLMW